MSLSSIFTQIMSINEVKRHSISSFASKIMYTLIVFLSTIYFAQTVGPSILGNYFLFLSYFGIIDMISDGGFGRAAVKRISEGEEQNEYYSAFLVLRTTVTAITIISLFLIRNLIPSSVNTNILNWLILAQFVALFHCLVSKGIAGRGKIGIYVLGEFTNNTSRVIIQIIAIFLGYYFTGLMGGFILAFVIATLIQFKFFDLHLTRFKWKHIQSLITFAFWLFLTSAGVILYSHADVIMIGYFLDESSVGIYKITFQLAAFTSLITASLNVTLWPKISNWKKKEEKRLIEIALSRAITFSLFLAIPIFAGGMLLGKEILFLLYGEEFISGHFTLLVLLFTQLINIFQSLFTMCLSALDQQKDSFNATAIGSITNILLNFFMIPLIGIEGAAVATFVTLGLNAFLARKKLLTTINVRIEDKSIVNMIKATIPMSAFILIYNYLINIDNIYLLLPSILLGASIYVGQIIKIDSVIKKQFQEIYNSIILSFNSAIK